MSSNTLSSAQQLSSSTQASNAFTISKLTATNNLLVVVVEDSVDKQSLLSELNYFLGSETKIAVFPDWETLPYDSFSPHQDIISERLTVLSGLRNGLYNICIVSSHTAMQKLPPVSFVDSRTFTLTVGETIDRDQFITKLVTGYYKSVPQVERHGEFALRGGIIDLFPMGHSTPYRIELFDDTIDSLRTFCPDSQCSIKSVETINCLPGHEFSWDESSIATFRLNWREHFSAQHFGSDRYQRVSDAKTFPGIEQYLPLFFEHDLATLFDYFDKDSHIAHLYSDSTGRESIQHFEDLVTSRYNSLKDNLANPCLPVKSLYLSCSEYIANCQMFSQDFITSDHELGLKAADGTLLPITISINSDTPLENLSNLIAAWPSHRILISINSAARYSWLVDTLISHNLAHTKVKCWRDFVDSDCSLAITMAPLSDSFADDNTIVLTEKHLFKGKLFNSTVSTSTAPVKTNTLNPAHENINFKIGAPIVHDDHGVGRYLGLQTIQLDNQAQEFLALSYADKDKLYVPINQLGLLRPYAGADPDLAPLDKLGANLWQKKKAKAKAELEDIAAKLLAIYAKRAASSATPHEHNEDSYADFVQSCPFTATPDQQKAIDAVIYDMTQTKPMDRLICGDVGFGKTEVAMHAAFVSVLEQRQVLILVPTTLLAEQHYHSFQERFANWPVMIDHLSRFRTLSERKQIVADFNKQQIDILIGTHQLLTAELNSDNLGLLIIDEEHRFGVKQKEKIKSLRAQVDLLSLTATPIPRTLNFALAGIRDLSLITTAPDKRLAVKTFVYPFQNGIIIEAIQREHLRGGQTFFLHNEVSSIDRIAKQLRDLLPEVRLAIAHGQMPERKLETIMKSFVEHELDILLCTTIIESGIDIPNANTIIINRADKLGLAQLHQCRGRVGRSHRQAYAYLLTPEGAVLSGNACKRLDAIQSLDNLGAGFNLASHDLEIRGAGELLGDQQSGHVQTIGLNLYSELLAKAIKKIQQGKYDLIPDEKLCQMDIKCAALIPSDLIADPELRLSLYQRLQSLMSFEQIQEFKYELQDRFGATPSPVLNLLKIRYWQIIASRMAFHSIKSGKTTMIINLGQNPKIEVDQLILLLQTQPHKYTLKNRCQLICQLGHDNLMDNINDVLLMLYEKLATHKDDQPCKP